MTDITVGQVRGVFGIDGRVRVMSFTKPLENISKFKRLMIGPDKREYEVLDVKHGSPGMIVRLEGVDDRDQATALMNQKIAVKEEWLEKLPPDTYYWFELVGLDVINQDGQLLGNVKKVTETGSNDVLTVSGARFKCLIPYVRDKVIKKVDRQNRKIIVDWEVEWCDEN